MMQIQLVFGHLNFVCKDVVPGNTFLHRMADTTRGAHHRIRGLGQIKVDLITVSSGI